MEENKDLIRLVVDTYEMQVKELFVRLSALLAGHGIEAKPWRDASLPAFRKLDIKGQERVLGHLEEICVQMEIHRDRDLDTIQNQILWRVSHQFGFRFPANLFEELPKDAVIELYSKEGTQIFRSLQFFRLCSYTLEEIYCTPWFELFDHHKETMAMCAQMMEKAVKGELRGVIKNPFPNHDVAERLSAEKLSTTIEPVMIGFFGDADDNYNGFLHVFRCVRSRRLDN